MPKRQLLSTKMPTYTPWKTLQSTTSLLQGICQSSSPMTSGMKRSGGMAIPNLLPLSRMKQSLQMPKSYFPNWRWFGRAHRSACGDDAYPLELIVLPGEEIQRHLPETLHVEATGLGGRDLLYPIPWDISIRSDKEGQSIYGPSLAPMEETADIPGMFGGTETVQVTKLLMNSWCYITLDWTAPCTFVRRPAGVSLPGCLSPSSYCSGDVWSLTYCTFPPQNAPRVVD